MHAYTTIIDGHPWSYGDYGMDVELFADLPEADQALARVWIMAFMVPSKGECDRTSYGLKHLLEHDTGVYMTNNQFKDLMLTMHHAPIDPDELNWRFRVSNIALRLAGQRPSVATVPYDRPRGWMNPVVKEDHQ